MTLNVLDLFSGIGGFSLGLERTGGFKTIAFCEVDVAAQRVLKHHWPDAPIFGDVRTLTKEDIAETVHIMCGGFPCQDISQAGLRAGIEGERSGLWSEYFRLIGEFRPKYAIIENVSSLRSQGLALVLQNLSQIGYCAEWNCIPASACGASHERDRIWIVAYPISTGPQGRLPRWQDAEREGITGRIRRYLSSVPARWITLPDEPQASTEPPRTTPTEPRMGRNTHGIPFELDLIRKLNGETNSKEAESEASFIEWSVLQSMWKHKDLAETSSDLYRARLRDSVPNLPYSDSQAGWNLGKRIKEDQGLCDMWQAFYPKPFKEAQDLQQGLLERLRAIKCNETLATRAERIKQLGNAVVPQIPELLGRAIMKENMKKLLMIALLTVLSGCGNKDVSFNTLEESKQTARDNGLFNAQRFRQENPQYQDWSVVSNGDSTQMPNCPQGDGWATLKLVSPDRNRNTPLKCSTVSSATGCLVDSEFKGKPYASQDGHCQDTSVVPFPLPKIAK